MIMPFRPALAGDTVMHVGEPVATVVAETRAAAQDAAELVAVDYEELPAVVDPRTALHGDAQFHPEAPGNLCIDWPGPVDDEKNMREVAEIFATAAHVARVSVDNQRMVVASMETRGATGVYEQRTTATPVCLLAGRRSAAQQGAAIMGIPNEKLRVITEDVGGAFGMKTRSIRNIRCCSSPPQVGRPVHWNRRARKRSCPTRRRVTP